MILEVLVDTEGSPSTIRVLRTVDLLEAAAIEAVEAWSWSPYEISGRPVPGWVTVTVNFRIISAS